MQISRPELAGFRMGASHLKGIKSWDLSRGAIENSLRYLLVKQPLNYYKSHSTNIFACLKLIDTIFHISNYYDGTRNEVFKFDYFSSLLNEEVNPNWHEL